MQNCDTLLMIGSGFPWTEFLPPEGKVRAVQIDIDPAMLGLRYPCEVNLHGDAAETLRALLPLLTHKADRHWQEAIAVQVRDWWALMEQRAMAPANPVNPQRVCGRCPSAAGRCNCHLGLGLLRQLVCARLSGEAGPARHAVGWAGLHGRCRPVCYRREFAFPTQPVVALVGDGRCR